MPLPPLQAARSPDLRARLPLALPDGSIVGSVAPEMAPALRRHGGAFTDSGRGLVLHPGAALDAAVRALSLEGWIPGWRDERYSIPGTAHTLERAAFRPFGLPTAAAHLNGWVRHADGAWSLWIARRSAAKPVDPGLLDNLVAGGIAAGRSPEETLEKECGEEAGIPPALARAATRAGAFRVVRAVEEGVHDEVIHAFDLQLPEGFRPENRDGEVAAFERLDPAAVRERIAASGFTVDAGLATVDFLWRHGGYADAAVGAALESLRHPG